MEARNLQKNVDLTASSEPLTIPSPQYSVGSTVTQEPSLHSLPS